MKIKSLLPPMCALLLLGAPYCNADPVWATGHSLFEIIGEDLHAHDTGVELTDYQTNAVCLLLGYFRGFAESSALTAHYDPTALPFFLPDNITNDQIERTVYQYLTDNRDRLDLAGDVLMVAALTKAFPNPSFTPPAPKASPTP